MNINTVKDIKSKLKLLLNLFFKSASNDRDWNVDQEVLSYADINGNLIDIYNVRNISYRNTTDFDIYYYNRSVNLDDLASLDYIIEDLDGFPGFCIYIA